MYRNLFGFTVYNCIKKKDGIQCKLVGHMSTLDFTWVFFVSLTLSDQYHIDKLAGGGWVKL